MSYSTILPSFCVYKVANSINDKLYIGITNRSVERRWKEHVREAKNGSLYPLHCAMRKYGSENFTPELLEVCIDGPALLEQEKYWIQHYNSIAPYGYNANAGGVGFYGLHLTEDHKQKIARANTGRPVTPEFCERMSEIARTRAQDPAYLAKLSQARMGVRQSEASIEKIKEARGRQVFTPESIEKRMQNIRGMKHTDEARAHMSAAQKGRIISPEHRIRLSESHQTITNEQAAIIRYDAYGLMQKEYAALFHLSAQNVNNIVKGRTYKHVTREHLPKDTQEKST